ncbi:ABC transporter ATP-binding protein [Nocardia bhagyanarayanae]|uniref:ABC-2 type transport system ATP-binding protein n=1 Tax=Nocardia bhagyanarayanae TaxID=1215925 RepID=A0A543FAF1_9NOCA|nr:ATP-binding cassette domain-containing protein [Nocardia bhagyanarayanae]TQM30803.1 ABC-2 type transport system ATP-binding protein [Nocardia bhagyanarayanae]
MTRAKTALVVRGLSKRYELGSAVEDVGFSVPAGSTAALVGPAGSGKTTILRILLGLLEPSSGSAEITASPVGGMLAPRGLHPGRAARDHLLVYAAAAGVPDARVDAVLEAVGMTDAARVKAGALSIGQQTRLALATALLTDPPVLILDEPTEGLDPAERGWLHDFLRRHTRRGGTVLLSSASLASVVAMADQLIVVSEGAVVYQGTPAKLRRNHPDRLVVAASTPVALATMLAARGYTDAVIRPDGRLAVAEASEAEITDAAKAAGVRLDSVTPDPIHPDRVLASLTKPSKTAAPMFPPPAAHAPHPQPTPYGIPR